MQVVAHAKHEKGFSTWPLRNENSPTRHDVPGPLLEKMGDLLNHDEECYIHNDVRKEHG